jgi:hypothetical protein
VTIVALCSFGSPAMIIEEAIASLGLGYNDPPTEIRAAECGGLAEIRVGRDLRDVDCRR